MFRGSSRSAGQAAARTSLPLQPSGLPLQRCPSRCVNEAVRATLNGTARHDMREVLDVVELLTSELVTSTYQYAKGNASLRPAGLGGGWVRVWVRVQVIEVGRSGAVQAEAG